jgi:hypothetical protein
MEICHAQITETLKIHLLRAQIGFGSKKKLLFCEALLYLGLY